MTTTLARDTKNKKYIPMDERPRCTHPGCTEPGQHMGIYKKDGTPVFRSLCAKHHNEAVAAVHGFKSIVEVSAAKKGMSVTDYINHKHPYRKHRKTHCENIDGRLGYSCNYEIRHTAQLQVDHIDGDPSNNTPENLQTLCANCHIYKTHANKDYSTPGRKALKQKKLFTDLIA